MSSISRRKFVSAVAASFAGGAVSTAFSKSRYSSRSILVKSKKPKSKVTIAKMDKTPGRIELEKMLDRSMAVIIGETDPIHAWKSLFKPNEVIGIKVNALGGKHLSSSPVLSDIVARKLIQAGVKPKNIIIWDRTDRELAKAGFKLNKTAGIKCYGTDSFPYGGYQGPIEFSGEVGSIFSYIMRQCNAFINIPVLKDHDIAGISLSMKNWYGAIHNPNKYHDDSCTPFVADLNLHPHIRTKQRLVIADALTVQPHGGPAYKPQWAVGYNAILASTDPVAIDRTGHLIIEKLRKGKTLPTLKAVGRYPKYLPLAERYGLGNFNIPRIDRIEVT